MKKSVDVAWPDSDGLPRQAFSGLLERVGTRPAHPT
jgi:hypothetical protein